MPNWLRKKEDIKEDLENGAIKPLPLSKRPALKASPAYNDGFAHLADELRWLNRVIAAHVLRLRRVDFYDRLKNFRDFFIADEEIDALLAAGIFEPEETSGDEGKKLSEQLLAQAQELRRVISLKVKEALAQNVVLPFAHLTQRFQLSEFEQQVLLIGLAPQIDARYEKLYAYLQNDVAKKFPSVDLILSLLAPALEARMRRLRYFAPASPLRHFALLEYVESDLGASAAQHFLRTDPRLVQYLLGNNAADYRVATNLRFLAPVAWERVIVPAELQVRLRKLLAQKINANTPAAPIFYFSGRSGLGKKTLARALCGDLGVPLAWVEVNTLWRTADNFREKARLILREGLLQPCAVYFDCGENNETPEAEKFSPLLALLEETRELGWLTFIGSTQPLPAELLEVATIYAVEVPALDYDGQKTLWQMHLNGALPEAERPRLDDLAARFDLTGGQISRAVQRAKLDAAVHDPDHAQLEFAALLASSRFLSQPKLTALTRKISPKFVWPDIVLPEDQMRQLRELANQVKHRQTVMGAWGFANKLSLGQGLTALFAGPSGTGKTMAAEVVASELALDLYKIDLAAVVSKYIGETEKNLNRVFTEAERSNAILFFDEADALLGKRSEVKDAHDRYANIEIAYLLQKMEEYTGITILATNLRQNIDEAFTRRIRFIIEFPFPNEEYRLRIWQGIWPEATPRAPDTDLPFMARQFELTGGNIRNTALAAAFFAASDGGVVNMKHLILATKREFQKMGKLSVKEDFGAYKNFI